MGWRPSDRNGVVLLALQRIGAPRSAADIAWFIHGENDLRVWWRDLPTPGQSHRDIACSAQNVQNRLYRLEFIWAVVAEDGAHPQHGWRQRQFRLVGKDEREAIRLRLQTQLHIPATLERKALSTATEMGLKVDFFIRGSDHGHYFAVCRIVSKRGEAEHRKWVAANLRAVDGRKDYLHEKWSDLLAEAGLIEP